MIITVVVAFFALVSIVGLTIIASMAIQSSRRERAQRIAQAIDDQYEAAMVAKYYRPVVSAIELDRLAHCNWA